MRSELEVDYSLAKFAICLVAKGWRLESVSVDFVDCARCVRTSVWANHSLAKQQGLWTLKLRKRRCNSVEIVGGVFSEFLRILSTLHAVSTIFLSF